MTDALLAYVIAHPHIGLVLSFLFAFLEALPIIGTFIPGIALMSVSGYWIGANIISFQSTLICCFLGALLGDYISFWLGFKYQNAIYKINYFKSKADVIEKAKRFLDRYGPIAIVLGRFFGPVRSSVPLIAGLLTLSAIKFTIGAIPSALLWSIVYLSPGIFYGSAAMFLPKHFFNLVLYYGSIILIITFYYRYQAAIASYIAKQLNRLNSRFICSKYHIWLCLNILVSWGLFLQIWLAVVHQVGIEHANAPVYYFLQSIRTPVFDQIMYYCTLFGQYNFIIPWCVVWLLYLNHQRKWAQIQHFILMIALTFILTHAMKLLCSIERPPIGTMLSSTYSFPSGHTAIVVAIMSSLRWACSNRKAIGAFLPSLFYTSIIFLTGFSRLYLGMHWLTDIFAAFLLVHPTILFTNLIIIKHKPIPFRNMFGLFALTAIVSFGITALFINPKLNDIAHDTSDVIHLDNYQPMMLPLYQNNRTHTDQSPLNIQFTGNLETLDQSLAALGFVVHLPKEEIHAIVDEEDHINHQVYPLLPPLLFHKAPIRTYTHQNQNHLTLLRLWSSPFIYNNQNIFLGSVYVDPQPNQPSVWLNKNRITYSLADLRTLKLQHKIYFIDSPNQNHHTIFSNWDNQLMVIRNDSKT